MNISNFIHAMEILLISAAFFMCCGYAKSAAQYTRAADGLLLNLPTGRMKVEVCADNIVHILFSPTDSLPERKSLIRVEKPLAAVKWDVKEGEDNLEITTKKIRIAVSVKTGALMFYNTEGDLILREPADGGRTMARANVSGEDVYSITQSFMLSADEGLYGLGQFQDGIMNYRGHDIVMAQVNTIVVVPFLVSTRGYGILWDNYSLTKFHDGADGMFLWSEVADGIDYYFVYGPEVDAVISIYRELTGAAPMFGKWAYGYWQSKERYTSGDELLAVAGEYRARKLPIDNIVQDWMYWGKYGWSAMKFDEMAFPNPEKTIAGLHKLNFHIMISIWPKFDRLSDIYMEMDKKGHIIKGAGGAADPSFYDAHSEEARKIYWRHVKKGIFSKGMDAWWMDATEPEVAGGRSPEEHAEAMKKMGRLSLGTTARYLNTFPLMSTKGVYENMRKDAPGKRVFILTRSAFAGQQRNAAVTWSGDIEAEWEVLRNQISAGINFCMAGIPYWTTDIGAFHVRYAGGCENQEYREMYVRWFQFGAFSPIFRSHGTHTPREIWRFGEPGDWGYDTLEKFDNLRYRLLPYIYSLAWKVTSEGYTIMRGLPLDFRNDVNVRNIDDQFMFGHAFLVNPVTVPMYNKERLNAGAKILKKEKVVITLPIITDWKVKSRKVYLPQSAGWYDFWTGKHYEGGQTIEAAAPIDIMPLYVRAGSIVPMGPKLQYATEKPADPIELRVYQGADGEFNIYEDENDNYNYEKGVYAIIPIRWDEKTKTLTIGDCKGSFPGMLEKRIFNIVIVGGGQGVGVDLTEAPNKTITYAGRNLTV
ncbi:MAG: TIM-barrel domain-containing protein, partial [bacterium]